MSQTDTEDDRKVSTLAAWKRAKTHTITVPSGTVIEIEIPDLPNLIKTGSLPNELIEVAIGAAQGRKVTADDIKQQAEFYNKLVSLAVTNPKVSEEEVASGALPFEDKEMIVEFAVRQRDFDAIGHHPGGLEKVAEFRLFRNLGPSVEDLAAL